MTELNNAIAFKEYRQNLVFSMCGCFIRKITYIIQFYI
jgi:hypothetical protein